MKYGLYLLMLTCRPSLAQLNESDTARLQLRVSLTGNYQQGNVAVLNLRGRVDFTVASNRTMVFKSQNSSLYQTFFETLADNDLFSRNYLYHRPDRRFYPFAIAYVSTNFRRRIDWRYFVGAGSTVQLWRATRHGLKASVGAVYEATRFAATNFNDNRYDGSQTIALGRLTTWVGGWHVVLDGHLRLYYDAYYQFALANSSNHRWQVDIGFDFPVWCGLALNALYSQTYENVVIAGVRPDDKILTIGLAYGLRRLYSQ